MRSDVGDQCQTNGKIGTVSSMVFRSRTDYINL